jgi:hypothetical protein
VDTTDSTSRPEVAAGDPFIAAGSRRLDLDQEGPCGCWDGWVYLGWEDPETGEEEIERVRCRRCGAAESR